MPNVNLYNQEGKEIGKAELTSEIFDVKLNSNLVHQAVVAQTANKRQVLAHTKDRSEVRGGGKRPWPGQARLHSFADLEGRRRDFWPNQRAGVFKKNQ